jgi:hypothetical protein
MSFIKTILTNPLYSGIAYAIEYFAFFSIVPIVTFSILDTYGFFIQQKDPVMLIIFGSIISTFIFFQKALRRSHFRLSGACGIVRYFVSLIWVFIIANMVRVIWVYGSIYQTLWGSTLWASVDYSFVIGLVLIVFVIRFIRYGYQIIFAKDLKGEPGVETLEEEIRREVED